MHRINADTNNNLIDIEVDIEEGKAVISLTKDETIEWAISLLNASLLITEGG